MLEGVILSYSALNDTWCKNYAREDSFGPWMQMFRKDGKVGLFVTSSTTSRDAKMEHVRSYLVYFGTDGETLDAASEPSFPWPFFVSTYPSSKARSICTSLTETGFCNSMFNLWSMREIHTCLISSRNNMTRSNHQSFQ